LKAISKKKETKHLNQNFVTPWTEHTSIHLLKLLFLSLMILHFPKAQAFDLQIRGFGDIVASKSSVDIPIGSINADTGKQLTLDSESHLGLNFSSDLGNKLTFSSQILGEGLGGGQYTLNVDWFFVSYHPLEELTFRVGRQINPIYLYSEQVDVGFIYPTLRHPSEVYGLDPLESFDGISAIYTVLQNDLQWRAQLYAGGGSFTTSSTNSTYSGSLDDDKGIDLSVSDDHFKVRIGYSAVNPNVNVNQPYPVGTSPYGPVTGNVSIPADAGSIQIFSAGSSFDIQKFMGLFEAIRMTSTGSLTHSATGMYGTLGYHVSTLLTPYVTYAWEGNLSGTAYIYPDTSMSTTALTDQHSMMLGATFRASTSVILKAEYMRNQQNFVASNFNFGANVFSTSVDFVF